MRPRTNGATMIARRGGGGIAVAAGRAAQHAVGAGQHVNVEAGVDFQRAQHHHVEPIDRRALGTEVGVLVGADFDMARVARQRGRRRPIEALHVQQLADQPFLVQIHHGRGDAAEGERGANAAGAHLVLQEPGHRQRGAAGAGLQREAFGEVAGTGDHLGGAAGDQQLARVRGHARGVGADLVGVAHPLQLHDQIHLILRQAGGMMRVRHQLLGQQHHGARRLGVHPRIAERAAAGFTAVTVGVAELIAGRHAEEGHSIFSSPDSIRLTRPPCE